MGGVERQKHAMERLEAAVRMEKAKRHYQEMQNLVKENLMKAEERRAPTRDVLQRILSGEWAQLAIDKFLQSRHTDATAVRQFMENMMQEIHRRHNKELSRIASGNDEGDMTEEDQQMLSSEEENCLQLRVVMPLQEGMLKAMYNQYKQDDRELSRRQDLLQGYPQDFFGVPVHAQSKGQWKKAVELVSALDDAVAATPAHRLEMLLSVKKKIEMTYEAEAKERGMDPSKHPLSADEVMPIFTFVVANSQTYKLKAVQMYLYEIAANGAGGMGEAGYYLCVLEAAIGHILSMDITEVEEKRHRQEQAERAQEQAEVERQGREKKRLQDEQLRDEQLRKQEEDELQQALKASLEHTSGPGVPEAVFQPQTESLQQGPAMVHQNLQGDCPNCRTTVRVKAGVLNICGRCSYKFHVRAPAQ